MHSRPRHIQRNEYLVICILKHSSIMWRKTWKVAAFSVFVYIDIACCVWWRTISWYTSHRKSIWMADFVPTVDAPLLYPLQNNTSDIFNVIAQNKLWWCNFSFRTMKLDYNQYWKKMIDLISDSKNVCPYGNINLTNNFMLLILFSYQVWGSNPRLYTETRS